MKYQIYSLPGMNLDQVEYLTLRTIRTDDLFRLLRQGYTELYTIACPLEEV